MEQDAFTIDNPSVEAIEATLAGVNVKIQEWTATVAASKARLLELAEEQTAAGMAILLGESRASKWKEDIAAETNQLRRVVEDATGGLKHFKVLESNLNWKLKKARKHEALSAFDALSAKLVSQAAKVGDLVSQIPALMQEALATGDELNRLALKVVPADSKLRSQWGNANSVFTGLANRDGSTVFESKELKEAALVGRFVESRMTSLRSLLEMALNQGV